MPAGFIPSLSDAQPHEHQPYSAARRLLSGSFAATPALRFSRENARLAVPAGWPLRADVDGVLPCQKLGALHDVGAHNVGRLSDLVLGCHLRMGPSTV